MTPYSDNFLSSNAASALTIGFFDGVHKGHRSLIQKMQLSPAVKLIAVTFTEHPSSFFSPDKNRCYLTDLDTKVELLRKAGIDEVLLYDFNEKIAGLTYDQFLQQIYQQIPFSHLFLGENAAFGKNREGTPDKVRAYCKEHNITAHYIPLEVQDQKSITSTRIRKEIKKGNLLEASLLLGREYCSIASSQHIEKTKDGFYHRALIKGFCTPPSGSYCIHLEQEKERVKTYLKKNIISFCSKNMYKNDFIFFYTNNPVTIK